MRLLGCRKSYNNKIINDNDYKVISNIKTLALDMINDAKSGHPGIVLSAAPIIYDIYAHHLVFDNKNPDFINRDRFVLSAGHGSALLYATLFMSGFNISVDDLKKFRQLSSITPGHPEVGITPGVDMTTGPLGEGFASAVGMAIAEKFLNNRYLYTKEKSLIDHYTYVLCGDGDLMEGVSYEAASIAGNLNLGKLIVLYDSNNMTLDSNTKYTFKEDVLMRFKAMNWDTHFVDDGCDLNKIDEAIRCAKKVKDKPSIIEVKTILGLGSKLQNTNLVHGKPLDEEDLKQLKKNLHIRDVSYTISQECYEYMNKLINERNKPLLDSYEKTLNKVLQSDGNTLKQEFIKLLNNDLSFDFSDVMLTKEETDNSARDISHIVLNKLFEKSLVLGTSCDVASSTKAFLDNKGIFTSDNLKGQNLLLGVREHASGAIINGIALSGIRCFASTFLAFSDYLKPAIRMSAIMNLPVIYIFTHDSIEIGEDGITHQPVEQLVGLRSIPNLTVYRPYDANEILGSYKSALKDNGPSVIVISKDKSIQRENTKINDVDKGGYIVKDYDQIMGIIISTGKELGYALEVAERLEKKQIFIRVVSMPSIEKFDLQKDEYKEKVLPSSIKKVVIEFSSSYSWYKFVQDEKYLINVNNFGFSGQNIDILEKEKLNIDSLEEKIENLLK